MKHLLLSKPAVVVALLLALCGAGHAQDAGGRKSSAPAAQNPEGVYFTIRFKDGRKQFRQGEAIPVEMSFSSSRPHIYRLDSATYDRSGRLEADDFHLSPRAGYVDPLNDYFNNGLFGFMGGGLRGNPELESKPYLITLDLNEWVRFEQPGKYRLYVTNKRVSKIPTDGRTFGGEALPLTSNTIELEILTAEPVWAKQKLQEAAAVLDGAKNALGHRAACRQLRFLNTEGAAREMIRRFVGEDSECEFEYQMGLMGSSHRQMVIEEMEEMFGVQDYPVTSSFIFVLSFLKYTLSHTEPMPPYPAGEADREKLWHAEMQKRRDSLGEINRDYAARLSAAVRGKQGKALAVSLGTLLDYRPGSQQGTEVARDEQLASALTAVFSDLTPYRQQAILTYQWKQVGSPDMLPVLRKIYEKPNENNRDLRDVALRRINELAPDEGRRLILSEIQSGHPRINAPVLGLLPDETLPELDDFLASRVEQPEGDYDALRVYSALLARYATSSALPRVKATLDEKVGKLACEIQANLLAYMMRVDPSYGVEALERALASRKDTRCYSSMLIDLTRLYWRTEMAEVALAHLNDPSPEVMGQAADILGKYGPASAEQPLWTAFEQWRARYDGDDKRLRADMKKADVMVDPSMIENTFVHALGSAGAWLTNEEKLKRLQQLCITDQCRQEAGSMLQQSRDKVINVFFDMSYGGVEHIGFAQYNLPSVQALKEKLEQFPAGTTFMWGTTGMNEKANEQLFADMQGYLKERGMKLEKLGAAK